jgi:hypothetical protein
MPMTLATRSVRPEPVEGLFFFPLWRRGGEGFDKLSPNGLGSIGHE